MSARREQAALTATVALSAVLPLLLSPWKAQALGPTGRGEVTFFQSGLTILLAVAALGARHAYYEIRAQFPSRFELRDRLSFWTSITLSAVVAATLIAIGARTMPSLVVVGLAIGCLVAPFQALLQREIAEAQVAQERKRVAVLASTPAYLESSGTVAGLALRLMSVGFSVALTLAAEFVRVALAISIRRRDRRRLPQSQRDYAEPVDISPQTIRLGLVAILPLLIANVDSIIFAVFVPIPTLGHFAITKIAITLLLLVASTMEGSVVRAPTGRAFFRYFLTYFSLAAVGAALGYLFTPLLFGSEFESSRVAFIATSITAFFAASFSTLATRAVWLGRAFLARTASSIALTIVVLSSIVLGMAIPYPAAWQLAVPGGVSYLAGNVLLIAFMRGRIVR